MTAIIISPELELSLVERRGIFTIPTEDATLTCNCPKGLACGGIAFDKIPLKHRTFEMHARELAKRFIERQAVRGYELVGDDLRLHGPFWSYDFNNTLTDINSSLFKDAQRQDRNGDTHPELVLGAVFERDLAFNPYVDYRVVGQFLKQAVITEVISRDDG